MADQKEELAAAEYILWERSDGGWRGEPMASVQDAVMAEKYTTQWFITKRCDWIAKETRDY